MERKAKHVYESKTTQIQILMPRHINGYNRLFGGKLVEWIDVVAAVTARRHSGCNVTTACIDNLQFQSGAHANNTIVIEGQLTWVGRTSMEVRVDTFVEELDGKKTHINRAYLIMVALDEKENPTEVPALLCDTDEEKAEIQAQIDEVFAGMDPTVEEIARELDIPKEEVVMALESIVEPISLYEPVYSEGGDTLYVLDQVGDNNDESNWLDEIALKETVAALSDREKMILNLRFLQGKTQMEVAKEIGISQAQVSRLEKGAIDRIKEK